MVASAVAEVASAVAEVATDTNSVVSCKNPFFQKGFLIGCRVNNFYSLQNNRML